MPKKAKPKGTVYAININPTTIKQISIRERKNPRKARLGLVNEFNRLVRAGVVSNLKFDSDGSLCGSDFSRKLTDKEIDLVRKIVLLSQEPFIRKQGTLPKEEILAKRINLSLLEHERKGQFVFINPAIEMYIMEGEKPEDFILKLEMLNRTKLAAFRKRISKYNTPEEIQRNLLKQLRYFESVLKAKKIKEMVISVEKGDWDASITKVKLNGKEVIRETIARVPSAADVVLRVILREDGKIHFEEQTDYSQLKKKESRF